MLVTFSQPFSVKSINKNLYINQHVHCQYTNILYLEIPH